MGSNPYLIDGDEIGTLDAYVPMSFCTIWWIWLICPEVNTVDAAIARCTPDTLGTDTLTDGYGTRVKQSSTTVTGTASSTTRQVFSA